MNHSSPSLSLSDDPLLALSLVTGYRAWRHNRLAGAAALLGQALARARSRAHVAGELGALQLLGHVALESGDVERAISYQSRALELSRQVWHPVGEASSLHNLGLLAAATGDNAAAAELIAAAATLYDTLGHTTAAAAARGNLILLGSQTHKTDSGSARTD